MSSLLVLTACSNGGSNPLDVLTGRGNVAAEALGAVGGVDPDTPLAVFIFDAAGATKAWGASPTEAPRPDSQAGAWLRFAQHLGTTQSPGAWAGPESLDYAWSLSGTGGGLRQFAAFGSLGESARDEAVSALEKAGYTRDGDRFEPAPGADGPFAPPEVAVRDDTLVSFSPGMDQILSDASPASKAPGVTDLLPCLAGAHVAVVSTFNEDHPTAIAVSVKDGATSTWACISGRDASEEAARSIVPVTPGVKVTHVRADDSVMRLTLEVPDAIGGAPAGGLGLIAGFPEQVAPGF